MIAFPLFFSPVQVAALVPQQELEGEMGDPHMATQARLMGQALRKVNPAVLKSGTALIFINQVGKKITELYNNLSIYLKKYTLFNLIPFISVYIYIYI